MTLAFVPRLFCVVLAVLFLVWAGTSLLVTAFIPRALRAAATMPARQAAALLLTLRLLPFGVALFTALGLCLPSYLWFEPERFNETVSILCLAAAALGFALFATALARAAQASLRSYLFSRDCRTHGEPLQTAALVIDSSEPLLALSGIVRPMVVVSRGLAEALLPEELIVVLGHENAHRTAWDNLKRLSILVAPFGPRNGRRIERAWTGYTEYAADEQAVAGDPHRSIALASALVRVARAGAMRSAAPSAISFLADASDLQARVDRLLAAAPQSRSAKTNPIWLLLPALLIFNPVAFHAVQELIEHLVR